VIGQVVTNYVDSAEASTCYQTSCARGDTICPAPLLPRGRTSASRAAEQTQRSSSFPRPMRSHSHGRTSLTR